MLKLLQERVNSRTKLVNKMPEGDKRATTAVDTSKDQGHVEELTRKLARKLEKTEAGEGN